MELNLRTFFSELNGARLVVFTCLLVFSILLALKLDGLSISLIVLFFPLWMGEVLVFVGFLAGVISFIMSPLARSDISSKNDFISMCFQVLEHILLVMFLLLLYTKIEYMKDELVQPTWLLVFCPLLVLSFVCMIVSAWCIRHDKHFEFEMFFSANIVQFALISFKLDNGIQWSWSTVFSPTWLLFSLFYLGSIYSLLISIFLNRALDRMNPHRRSQVCNTLCNLVLGIPLLTFFILLTAKLDSIYGPRVSSKSTQIQIPYILVGVPLFVSLFSYLILSFGNTNGNTWWFGRKSICGILFDVFPCLQYYANTSYKFERRLQAAQLRAINRRQHDAENVQMINDTEQSVLINNANNDKNQQNSQQQSFKPNVFFSPIESPD